MTQKKTNEDGDVQNNTNTELQILQRIERSYFTSNESVKRRNTEKSIEWFRKNIPRNYNNIRTARMTRDRDLWRDNITIGDMYLFNYDAKHKDTLPVWDAWPLVFFFDAFKTNDGREAMLGINLHYLPPRLRQKAYTALLKTRNKKSYDRRTRLKISWQVLQSLANSKYFEHSVKMYLAANVRSKFIRIPPRSWELTVFLPLARWQNASKQTAWRM